MNVTNLHPLRSTKRGAGILKRFLRSCLESNERIFLSAVTDPKTGRVDPAVERQVVLMMLG